MVVDQLSLDQITSIQSAYQPYPASMQGSSPAIRLSIEQQGVLCPLLVHELNDSYQVIDGFKRADVAQSLQLRTLSCCILPKDTSSLDIATLLIQKDEALLRHSASRKSLFLALCHKLGLEGHALTPLLDLLGIENHPRVIRQYLNVAELPDEVLAFCDEKGFSLKQCIHLSKHPRALLVQLFQWRKQLHFTAAVIEEILGNFKDIMRVEGTDIETIEQEDAFIAIMQSQSNNQQRTQALRHWLRLRRYPRLSVIQSKMDNTVSSMNLTKSVTLNWDRNLENRALTITARITEPEQWPDICQALNDSTVQKGIDALLEEL
ncbi:MAG: ParB/RepB/Spo0J family partition protein [Gammaproteobacteria bacterium]|nr:ParB/RepB/Spo0J family partition protein [Gammaproteobacteria bacterium]